MLDVKKLYLYFKSRLVVTGAMVIGRDDWLPSSPSHLLFNCGPRLLDKWKRGESTMGDVLDESEGSDYWSVLTVGSVTTNMERRC